MKGCFGLFRTCLPFVRRGAVRFCRVRGACRLNGQSFRTTRRWIRSLCGVLRTLGRAVPFVSFTFCCFGVLFGVSVHVVKVLGSVGISAGLTSASTVSVSVGCAVIFGGAYELWGSWVGFDVVCPSFEAWVAVALEVLVATDGAVFWFG